MQRWTYVYDGIPFVVGTRNGFEGFLSGLRLSKYDYSVPNLYFNRIIVDLADARPELHTEGGLMVLFEATLGEPQQQTRFPYACVNPFLYSNRRLL
jgi:hypothetical protein